MPKLSPSFPAGRDRGVTVVVEGFFAFVWFGWGLADAPSWLTIPSPPASCWVRCSP